MCEETVSLSWVVTLNLFCLNSPNPMNTGNILKGHWTSITSSPNCLKKVGIIKPLEELACVMTAC